MNDKFTESEILNTGDLIGRELKSGRLEKDVSLETASKNININIEYLKAIEAGELGKLPKGVYGKSFIQEYAVYLGINPRLMIELYEKEYTKRDKKHTKRLFVKKVSKTHHFLTIPRIIKNTIIISVVVVCVAYLGYYINNIITPPELTLINLTEDVIVDSHVINIQGITNPEAGVVVNDETVLIDNEGNFKKEINLKSGLNVVVVVAQKKYSKKRIIKRNIIVK
jgi:cytoskeletal protein RodZ